MERIDLSDDVDDDSKVLVCSLTPNENTLLKDLLSKLKETNWIPPLGDYMSGEEKTLLQNMNLLNRELFLIQLVSGQHGYNSNSPFQTLVKGHERKKEIFKWKCINRDKSNIRCPAIFQLTKKGLWTFEHHNLCCLQTEKVIDIRVLKQRLGTELWKAALNHVAVVRKTNCTQDQCFVAFKD